MRQKLLISLVLAICLPASAVPVPGSGAGAPGMSTLLVEVRVESRADAEWLSRFDVRLAGPGLLLLEIAPEDEGLIRGRGLSHEVVAELKGDERLYCCPLAAPVPEGFGRLWIYRDQDVQVLVGRDGGKALPLGAHMAVPLPRDACATSWFPEPPPRAAAGRRAGAIAKQVAAAVSEEDIEAIINDLTYDAAAGTLLTRYSYRDETVEIALPYVRDRLSENLGAGGTVSLEQFELHSAHGRVNAYNIIGKLDGDVDGAGYYILSGHYDSIALRTPGWDDMRDPAPGADDNASGVAGVLECARVLASVPLDFDLKFILFSGEEQIIRGSTYHVDHMLDPSEDGPLLGVINLDMIAYNPVGETLEIVTDPRSAWIADFLVQSYEDLASEVGTLDVSAAERPRIPFSDDSAFQIQGYPAVTCIEDPNVEVFNPYYHTIDDNNVDGKLNIGQATKIARLVAGALAALAARQDSPDLEILPADIVFSAPSLTDVKRAAVGDTVTISVRVRNVGGPAADEAVDVKLYDGDPDFGALLLAEQRLTDPLPSMGGLVFRTTWILGEDDRGSHRITVVASLAPGGMSDADLSNNRARATFAVVAEEMDVIEDYVVPNPADPAGQASLHYFLTQPADIVVDVFDVRGRRVGGMTRAGVGGRVPGVNFMEVRVPMTEVLDDFSDLPGGVYFYRIAAKEGGLRKEKKGRFIIVR